MPSPGNRGFYAEVDAGLLEKFEEMFPEVGSKVELLRLALIHAIQHQSLNPGGGDEFRRDQGNPTESS